MAAVHIAKPERTHNGDIAHKNRVADRANPTKHQPVPSWSVRTYFDGGDSRTRKTVAYATGVLIVVRVLLSRHGAPIARIQFQRAILRDMEGGLGT